MYSMSELAPTTGRTANLLAVAYGFNNVDELAESLPTDARGADFGVGDSNLGETIVGLRNDVRWVGVDLRRTEKMQNILPAVGSNLSYVQASIFAPPMAKGSLDVVCSSWLLPHIEMDSHELALRAVHSMAQLLKPEGRLYTASSDVRYRDVSHNIVAKVTGGSLRCRDRAYSFSSTDYVADPDAIAEATVEAVKMSPGEARLQRFNNMASKWLSRRHLSLPTSQQ